MSEKEYVPFVIDVGLEEVETWAGDARPLFPVASDVRFKVVGVENDGKMITVQSEAIEGEHAGGRVWTNYMYTNPTGLKRTKAIMVACGAGLGQINSDDLLNAEYYGDVKHEEGKATPDAMGNPRPPKTFANVFNERAKLDDGGGEADPPPPPVTRSTTAATPAAAAKPDKAQGQTRNRRA